MSQAWLEAGSGQDPLGPSQEPPRRVLALLKIPQPSKSHRTLLASHSNHRTEVEHPTSPSFAGATSPNAAAEDGGSGRSGATATLKRNLRVPPRALSSSSTPESTEHAGDPAWCLSELKALLDAVPGLRTRMAGASEGGPEGGLGCGWECGEWIERSGRR